MSEQSRAVIEGLLREDLRGQRPYGAPQLAVPVALNTNESAYRVPEHVVAAMLAELPPVLATLNRYPDREFVTLRQALRDYLAITAGVNLPVTHLWAGNGSNEVLSHLVQAFAGPGRRVLGFTPSYSMHPILARTLGASWIDGFRRTDTGDFDLTPQMARDQAGRHDPHVVFLCSPNNPTGTALDFDVVSAVVEAAPSAVVVVDEAYAEFARPGTPSALELVGTSPRLVVTRTMSKAFAFAGARVGYLAGDPALIDALRLVRLPYHLSAPTQAIACVALRHAEALLGSVEALKEQRDRIVTETSRLGYRPVPSDANFVLVGGFADALAAFEELLSRGVLVRDVGIPGHLRVTAGTPQETGRFLAALADLGPEHVAA